MFKRSKQIPADKRTFTKWVDICVCTPLVMKYFLNVSKAIDLLVIDAHIF